MNKTTVIKSPSQLSKLVAFALFRKPSLGEIRLHQSFVHGSKSFLEKSINRHYYGPGYQACVMCLLYGATLGTVITLLEFLIFGSYLFHPVITVVSLALLSGVTGKIVITIRSRNELKRTIQLAKKYWNPEYSG